MENNNNEASIEEIEALLDKHLTPINEQLQSIEHRVSRIADGVKNIDEALNRIETSIIDKKSENDR